MGYLGQEASFTGTQNNKRLSVVATAGQVGFLPNGGYSINAIDVYRNGVKLVGQRDFTALDGVTVTLTQAANVNDVVEFVIFENFAVNDVVSTDGDSVIRGNIQVNGDLSVVGGVLNATVTNTATAGFAQTAGISTQVSGYLGVGVTGYNLNLTGVATATSFAGVTGSFSGNVTLQANLDLQDNNKILLGTGDDIEIYHDGTSGRITNSDGSFFVGADRLKLTNGAVSEVFVDCIANGRVDLFYDASVKLTTKSDGVDITGELQCDSLDVDGTTSFADDVSFDGASYGARWDKSENQLEIDDNAKIVFGTGADLKIYHNGSVNYIAGDEIRVVNNAVDETMAKFINGGAVELYHNDSKKLETSSAGVTVTGTLNATTDVQINGKGAATTGKAIAMAMVFG